ncbi:glycosyltransferase family 4 protein, partial [Candidatus Saccharibacteria bacterium]|nr:glycosyltransferase family 4 protein [Candidatus Saccharibacteria bacterium]
MKVGLVCPYNMYKGGGVQECVLALQKELEKRGHQARIITPQPRKHKQDLIEGVIFVGSATQVRSPFHTTAQVSASVKVDELDEVLLNEKFDILHFHEPWVPILSKQILSRSQCPNIATFHAKLPDTIMSRTIERVITPYTKSILKDLHHLTAVSDAAAEYVKSLTNDNVTIIPNGISIKDYGAINSDTQNNKSILFIGRLEKRKGVKYLINAIKQVRTKNVQLIIAGDGPDRHKLELLASQLGLNNVRFLGYVEDGQKKKLLANASIFCSPALYGESFGIVLLEAMSMGIPVVAGDNPGYTSVMKEIGALSLVNPKDTTALARSLD